MDSIISTVEIRKALAIMLNSFIKYKIDEVEDEEISKEIRKRLVE